MQYSTVPPWLPSKGKPLIDAVTGAPGRAFPLRGSEVVTQTAGVRLPFTESGSLSGNLTDARVFVVAFG